MFVSQLMFVGCSLVTWILEGAGKCKQACKAPEDTAGACCSRKQRSYVVTYTKSRVLTFEYCNVGDFTHLNATGSTFCDTGLAVIEILFIVRLR
jgi:hypothetical protein